MISLRRKKKISLRYGRWYTKVYRNHLGLSFLLFAIFIIILLSLVFNVYRHQNRYFIEKVLYTNTSIDVYDDIDMYSAITNLYKGSYYVDIMLFQHENIIKELKQTYPFISDIVIKRFLDNKLVLDPIFNDPLLMVRYASKNYALYENLILPLGSGNTLGNATPLIYLPQYLSGSTSLSGLLYAQSDMVKFANDVSLISNLPLSGVVVYVPGGEKYVHGSENQYIYFNAKKDLSGQIEQFYELFYNYPSFSQLYKIDIGSTDYPIVQ